MKKERKKEKRKERKNERKEERRKERRKEGKKERRKEGRKEGRKERKKKERKKDLFFLCQAQMIYQFNGHKMYEGNKSVLSFSKKVRNTFKIQNHYFFLYYAM